jgi:hypothetical protein
MASLDQAFSNFKADSSCFMKPSSALHNAEQLDLLKATTMASPGEA